MTEYPVTIFTLTKDQPDTSHKGKIVISNDEIEFWRESLENLSPHKKVTIARSASSGFGISIKGGKEHNRPIIISKCAPRNTELKVGDRIISCVGKSLLNSTHREAVEAIKNNDQEISLEVQSQSFERLEWPPSSPSLYPQINGSFWLCRLSRPKNPKYSPTSIEIATGDLNSRMIIEAESEEHADIFATAFRRSIASHNQANMDKLNSLLSSVGVFNTTDHHWKDLNDSHSNIELRRIDWLHEKISSTHYIVVLNDVEVRLYDKLPSSWTEWEKPQHVLPLLGTRSILEKDSLYLRTGTRVDVEVRQFQGMNLSEWLRACSAASSSYVSRVEEALVEIIYNEEKAFLGMHHDTGLKLYVLKDGKRTLKWTKHASTIQDIDDSDNTKLLLAFSDGSQFTFILGDGLRPFIFLILNFLEARTTN